MGILSWIIVGLIAGFLAGQVMKGGGYGVIGDIIVGVLGGLLGGWIAFYFFHIGDTMTGINAVSILVAFAGAILLILVLRMIGGRRSVRDDRV
ncbi:MAG: GlsB/YeaQ/YmgE family stress response membrane protein [Chloroflexota bacterium]|nr:MAG: GlsB/YeaQ/YmgE family stress response membrane protein [Chloroflexota bacterium]